MNFNINRVQKAEAVNAWEKCLSDYSTIQQLIKFNYVFDLSSDQIAWMRDHNKNKEVFSVEIGIFEENLIMILCPLDDSGKSIVVPDYQYSVLGELKNDLKLTEVQEYTVVKHSVLSTDFKKIDCNTDMVYPVVNKPVMEQDKAIDAIQDWRYQGDAWFYVECNEPYNGQRVFKKFSVPAQNLEARSDGKKPTRVVCSFALKYSDIFQRMLVTMLFISFYEDLSQNQSAQYISNTYDWSQACPPLCGLI